MITHKVADRLLLKPHFRVGGAIIEKEIIAPHKAAINVGRFESRLFVKSVDRSAVIDHEGSEAARRVDCGNGADLSRFLMALDAFVDVDIGDAVAVGEQKSLTRIDVLLDRLYAITGEAFIAGIGEGDA